MYDLPASPTTADIIARSIVCHPSLYADALDDAARSFAKDAVTLSTASVRATAKRLQLAAHACAVNVIDCAAGNCTAQGLAVAFVEMGPDTWTTALNIASRLQCLPPHLKREAVSRLIAG